FPNGSFLAWLPVPSGEPPRYELRATNGAEVANLLLPVRLPAEPMPLPDTGKLVVDRASVAPSGVLGLRGDERVRVSIRAPANATVALHLADGSAIPLVHGGGVAWGIDVTARELARPGTVIVHRGRDTVSVQTAAVMQMDSGPHRYVSLLNADVDATSERTRSAFFGRRRPARTSGSSFRARSSSSPEFAASRTACGSTISSRRGSRRRRR